MTELQPLMEYEIKQVDKFKFIEEGEGEPLILLHGLFGALSNFKDLIEYFRHYNKVVVPMLPLFDLDLLHTSVGGLEKFVHKFIEHKKYGRDYKLVKNKNSVIWNNIFCIIGCNICLKSKPDSKGFTYHFFGRKFYNQRTF